MQKPVSMYKRKTRAQTIARRRTVLSRSGKVVMLVLSISGSAISFARFGLSWTAIAIIALGVLFLVSIIANVIFLVDIKIRGKRPKQIAFLMPSSGGQPFYSSMLSGLVKSASLAFGQDYIILPSMPTESFETVSIWALFSSLEDRQVDIEGIIFIPDHPDRHFDELVGFHEKRGDVPLVLVDVYFNLKACDDRTRARLPSFVGGDEQIGGRAAAGIVINSVGTPAVPGRVIVIINGGTAPWEQQRAVSFREHIKAVWPDTVFVESPPINYSRIEAFEFLIKSFKERADLSGEISVDAIFACNDDMAIGARGAVGKLQRDGYSFKANPQIVGYDGIPEIREYIEAGDPYIAGTVDVRIEEQAKVVMLLMHRLLRSGKRDAEIRLVEPNAIRRS